MSVNPGDFYVVSGAPSSGKSVLLRIVLGLEPADAGTVHLGGKDVTSDGPQERHVGYVPQSFALFPNKSVRENILYPMRLDKVGKVQMQETLDRVCELLAIEDGRLTLQTDRGRPARPSPSSRAPIVLGSGT